MILALLLTQLVAVPFSILFSRFAEKIGSINMIVIAIVVYFGICGVGFYMGHHVEPYQLEFAALVDEAAEKPALTDPANAKSIEQLITDLKEDGKNALAAEDRIAAFWTEENGQPHGVLGDAWSRLNNPDNGHYIFTNTEDRQTALRLVESLKSPLLAYAGETSRQTAYQGALGLSTLLFWLMAVMVGMVQGGIQALSRSYYGRLIPAERSNEYFGFFDIFGKFAAVVGPFLYSLFYMATGRASIGILSLMALFLAGGVILVLGRKRLRQSEAEAASLSAGPPAEGSQE